MASPKRSTTQLEPIGSTKLDADWLKQLALEHGADDAGIVEIDNAALDDQRAWFLGEGTQSRVGPTEAKDSHQWIA